MSELLDASIRELLRTLEIGSRETLQGVRYGLHRSRRRGVSTDFTHHRGYQPGDPLKHIDWKVYARTNRHFVKQFIEHSALTLWTVLDNSASMHDQPQAVTLSGKAEGMIPKFTLAARLCAALCNLAIRQQDAAGLVVSGSKTTVVPPRSSNKHLGLLFNTIARSPARADAGDLSSALRELTESIASGHLVAIASDLFFEPDETRELLRELRGRGADILIYQVATPFEIDFDFSHWVDFRCLETKGLHHRVDTTLLREAYQREQTEFQAEWDQFAKRHGIEIYRATTSMTLTDILNQSLRLRASQG
jgi:uncharacterized protein (DUF58 family)